MRQICWLHISDLHLRKRDSWSQDIVLKAMCERIAKQRSSGILADFALVTGDLAFSGKADEYELASHFFDELTRASGVAKERIFCIPGNHDIERDRQKLSFLGARTSLHDENRIDALLGDDDDLTTLMQRQQHFRRFQNTYFAGQSKTWTADGLAYVAQLTVHEIRIAIVALDSAWLSEGGVGEQGALLIGERQVINALALAREKSDPPNIIVAMAHHPLHWLKDCDRRPVQTRIEDACHFFHCGHLHEPEARASGSFSKGCLGVTAGAFFETRHSHNAYCFVVLDLLQAVRKVKTTRFDPGQGKFASDFSEDYGIEVSPARICSVPELAVALCRFERSLEPHAHYLAALLLNHKAELPIQTPDGYTFGSIAVLRAQPISEIGRKSEAFMAFRNVLNVFFGRSSLGDMLARHGKVVTEYGAVLREVSDVDPGMKDRLSKQEEDARVLARLMPQDPLSHTSSLLIELATNYEWDRLRDLAERALASDDGAVKVVATRMLALSMAHDETAPDRSSAIKLYESLVSESTADAADFVNLGSLLMDQKQLDAAKSVVLRGLTEVPAPLIAPLTELGHRLIEQSGDRAFRQRMEEVIARKPM